MKKLITYILKLVFWSLIFFRRSMTFLCHSFRLNNTFLCKILHFVFISHCPFGLASGSSLIRYQTLFMKSICTHSTAFLRKLAAFLEFFKFLYCTVPEKSLYYRGEKYFLFSDHCHLWLFFSFGLIVIRSLLSL